MQRTGKRKTDGHGKLLPAAALQKQRRGDHFLLPTEMMIADSAVLSNDAAHVIVINQIVIVLTPIEYALLKLLLLQPGTPVASEALIQAAFPADLAGDETGPRRVARHITNIRPKLWQTPLIIHAVNNFGYVLRLSDAPAPLSRKKRKDS